MQKLGFDPMNPPALRTAPHEVDDNSPSIWAPLTTEERIFVYELRTGKKAPAELLSESGEGDTRTDITWVISSPFGLMIVALSEDSVSLGA